MLEGNKCWGCPYAVFGSAQNVCTLNACVNPNGYGSNGGTTNG